MSRPSRPIDHLAAAHALLVRSLVAHATGAPTEQAHALAQDAERRLVVAEACALAVAGPPEDTEDEAPADLPDDTEYDGASGRAA